MIILIVVVIMMVMRDMILMTRPGVSRNQTICCTYPVHLLYERKSVMTMTLMMILMTRERGWIRSFAV